MIRKIFFIVEVPFDKRDFERFGIDILIKRGFQVYVLDMTEFINPGYLNKFQPKNLSDYKNIIRVTNMEQFKSALSKHSDALFIDNIRLYERKPSLLKIFKRCNISYSCFSVNILPSSVPDNTISPNFQEFVKNIIGKLRRLRPENIMLKGRRLYLKMFKRRIQLPKVVLLGGEKSANQLNVFDGSTEKIWIHAFDYDLYLKSREGKGTPGKTIVFLDEYYPFHPDLIIFGLPVPLVDPKKYYGNLNKFFEYLESKMHASVIIAAHPRSQYEKHSDFFNRRKVVKFDTVNLVRDSQLVIAHSSTSVNYAVLFRKPLIFVTSDDIKNSVFGHYINNYSIQFDKKAINLDDNLDIDLNKELFVDDKKYQEFVNNYIKRPGTPEKPFWEAAADEFEKMA